MSGKFRNRTTSNLRRVASSLDLLRALKRSRSFAEPKVVGLASPEATSLPPQAPPFLAELPPVGATYEPQQHATKKLKAIIEENYYGTFFENAIKTVSAQNIKSRTVTKSNNCYLEVVSLSVKISVVGRVK